MRDIGRLVATLKAELAFLECGGYSRRPRFLWRPNFVFEDSPTCLNFQKEDNERQPCGECPLMEFVPQEQQEERFPCRQIRLTEKGETVSTFYEWGTEEELESALRQWLKQTIQQLESGEQTRAETA